MQVKRIDSRCERGFVIYRICIVSRVGYGLPTPRVTIADTNCIFDIDTRGRDRSKPEGIGTITIEYRRECDRVFTRQIVVRSTPIVGVIIGNSSILIESV